MTLHKDKFILLELLFMSCKNMTFEQEKDFKKRDIYNDIILMTNLTMIYCYIMFFALEEVVNIFGKRYRH